MGQPVRRSSRRDHRSPRLHRVHPLLGDTQLRDAHGRDDADLPRPAERRIDPPDPVQRYPAGWVDPAAARIGPQGALPAVVTWWIAGRALHAGGALTLD